MENIRQKMYDILKDEYGDEYSWFKIEITMEKEKPKNDGIKMWIDTDSLFDTEKIK